MNRQTTNIILLQYFKTYSKKLFSKDENESPSQRFADLDSFLSLNLACPSSPELNKFSTVEALNKLTSFKSKPIFIFNNNKNKNKEIEPDDEKKPSRKDQALVYKNKHNAGLYAEIKMLKEHQQVIYFQNSNLS